MFRKLRWLFPAFLFLSHSLLALGSDIEPVGTVRTGERLNPALYGPGIIESLEDVQAREANRPRAEMKHHNMRGSAKGAWQIPSLRGTYFPKSGKHNVVNKWGDTRMGIRFPEPTDVIGAYIAGQAGEGVWAKRVRVVGYLQGREVAASDWFTRIGRTPEWFEMNLRGVDRIVFEADAAFEGAAWYSIDDFTYTLSSARPGDAPRRVVLDFEDCNYTQTLTGTAYAGLTWEEGLGVFDANNPPRLGLPAAGQATGNSPSNLDVEPRGGGATTPVLTLDFEAVTRGEAGQFSYPPDTCGAVGPNHFVTVVNRNFAVFNKLTGAQISNVSLDTFLPGSSGDPRVLFDQYSGRWIVIVSDFNTRIYLAVSTTDNPTGTFFKTNFVASTDVDVDCFPDYPTLGVDPDGIYIASFMAGSGTCGNNMTIFAIEKAPLISGSPSLGNITAFRALPYEQAIQPVHTYGTPAVAGQYFVSRQSSTQLRVRRLTNLLTGPTLTTVGSVSIPSHSSPVDVPSMGSATPLDSIDNRLMNAVYRSGSIWTCHHVGISGRNAVRWYQINESPLGLTQSGTVDSGSLSYWMPSIMVNAAGDAILGFSGSSASQFAAAYYCGRLSVDAPGQMSPVQLLRAGSAAHTLLDGLGRNRWGDYSLCSLDPADESTLWTIQEYVHANNTWGTWVGKLIFGEIDTIPPSPSPPTFEIVPTPLSTSEVTMRCVEVIDANSPPTQYFFTFTTGGSGGSSSGWINVRDYTDTGLSPNALYNYSVRARDSATPAQNETAASEIVGTATMIQTPTGIAFSVIDETFITVQATGSFSLLNVGMSGIFLEMTPAHGTGANQWVQTTSIPITGLTPGTQYAFRVKARNRLGVETPFVGPETVTTLGCALLGDINSDTVVDALDIGGFTRCILGFPEGEDNVYCSFYGNPTIEEDVDAFVADLLAP